MFASNFPVDGLKGSWDYLYSQFKRAVTDFPLSERRNEGRDEEQQIVVGGTGKVADLAAALDADDAGDES